MERLNQRVGKSVDIDMLADMLHVQLSTHLSPLQSRIPHNVAEFVCYRTTE